MPPQPTLSDQQVSAVCACLGIKQQVKRIGVSQNEVFEVGGEGSDGSILRVSHGRGRSLPEIEAGLDWIEDLSGRGVDACKPRRSPNGRRCEEIEFGGETLLAVHFDRAPGRKVERADVSLSLYRSLEVLTGKLHTASFDHPAPQPRRAP